MAVVRKPRATPVKRAVRKAAPKKRGQPTKYTPDMCEKVVIEMAKGNGRNVLGPLLGVSQRVIYHWEERYPEFATALEDGAAASELWWIDRGNEGMLGQISSFNAAVWIFNMKNRFGWKDKQEISGDKDSPLKVEIVKLGDSK